MTAKSTKKSGASGGAISANNFNIPTIHTSSTNNHFENGLIHILNGGTRLINAIAHTPEIVGHEIGTGIVKGVKYGLSSSASTTYKFTERDIGKIKPGTVLWGGTNLQQIAGGSQKQTFNNPPPTPDKTYTWNLPPHKWSLPTDPATVNMGATPTSSGDIHSTRRGRIWFYQGYVGPTAQASNTTGIYTPPAKTVPQGSVNKYGFQFMWNPETYSQDTAVNMTVTPNAADPTIALTGFAAANSQIAFTLRLDRTNDFACAKSGFETLSNNGQIIDRSSYVQSLAEYYSVGGSIGGASPSASDIGDKIQELLQYGTEADLEYLYRVVNGTGWTSIVGRPTSNIGYLMPSLIRIDLGEQKFVGVISDISVNHLAFTKSMVPIRTDVNVTINLKANIQSTMNTSPSSTKGTP